MHRLRLSQAPPNYPLPRRSRTSSCSPRWQSLSLHTSCPRTANAREQFSPTATVSLFLRQDVSVSLRVWTPRDLCCGLYRQSWILGLVASSLGVWRVSCGTFERVARPFGCLTDHTIYPYAGSATVNPINPKNGWWKSKSTNFNIYGGLGRAQRINRRARFLQGAERRIMHLLHVARAALMPNLQREPRFKNVHDTIRYLDFLSNQVFRL
jgi:hypothetical protein